MITGGAGFIGSNLVKYFVEKYTDAKIIVVDKLTYASDYETIKDLNIEFFKVDIADFETIKTLVCEWEIDTIIHLAAESHVDNSIASPEQFVKTNLLGTFNLLEAARIYWEANGMDGKRFHHVSTDEVYGSLGMEDEPFNEATPYGPRSPYSATKAGSDHLVMAYYHTYGLPVTISNCSNNYGQHQHPEKLIPKVVECLCKGWYIPVYGNGMNVRDWLYVGDHVKAIDLILTKGKIGETYNIGGNNELTNLDILDTILTEFANITNTKRKSHLVTFVTDRKGHDLRYAINYDKIKNELGWEPETDFKEGIRNTIKYYLKRYNY
jgi:dTDP-glucose 4,6-dehydratase